MVRSDLISVAESLPDTGQDHKFHLIANFEHGGWQCVNYYIDYVEWLNKTSTASIQPRREKIIEKVANWVSNCLSWLKTSVMRSI